jgi:DNA polymerase I-like protein with 3'-5' exonuclease and polymerase domains
MTRKFADVCSDPAVLNFCNLALPKIQTRAKNQFVNSMIQGSCATLAKRSILNIRSAVETSGVRFLDQFTDAEKATARMRKQIIDRKAARFMLPIHDELVFSVHRDYVPEFIPILRDGMCNHPTIIRNLPLQCNVAIGRTFKPWDKTPYSQLELDEAPVIEGLIPEEFDGRPLPPEFYPKIVEWQMAA